MKNSNDIRRWHEFFDKEYEAIVRLARRRSRDPHDLVHHVFLRCRELEFPRKPMAYVNIALLREATRGQFKKLYAITPELIRDVAYEPESMELSFKREMIQMAIDRLSWFDREVMNLYLQGWNIAEVAEEAGIASGTLYQSLHRSKKFIKNALCNGKP